jgi:hypothetical protein
MGNGTVALGSPGHLARGTQRNLAKRNRRATTPVPTSPLARSESPRPSHSPKRTLGSRQASE